MLDAIGRRYGQRPSGVLGIEDAWLAFQFDYHCLDAGLAAEAQAHKGGTGTAAPATRQDGKFDERQFGDPSANWHAGKRNVKMVAPAPS